MPDDIRKQPWLVEIAIEPKSKADWEKLGAALAKLVADDPSFSVWSDAESAQIILRGTDELQLINKIDTLKRTYKIDAKIGAPQVAYREKITRQATVDYTHKKKQNGNRGQFARIKIVAQPDELNSGFTFENAIISGSVPKDFIPAIEKGLEGQMASGAIAGFPVLNVQVSLVDGASHDVDSSAMSFEIAARAAMREALQKGGSVLLEPIIKVEVETPPPYTESVIGDLNSRRGQIQGQDTRGSANVISAMVPFANMFFYVHDLRSISQGRATFTIRFDHYAAVPLPPDDDPPFRPAIGMRP